MGFLKNIVSKLFLFFLASFLSFLLLELSLRFYLDKTRVISDKGCRRQDRILHHSLIPKSTCRSRTKEWDVQFKINSLGLRDYEYNKEKAEGVYRILMLGDSFTEGYGVEMEETFPKLLEKELNSKVEKGKFEVINAGITGYSPTLEYLYFRNYGLELKPDLVVLNFSMTDFYDDYIFKDRLLVGKEELEKIIDEAEPEKKELGVQEKQIWAKGKAFEEEIPGFTIPASPLIPFIPSSFKWWLHRNFVFYDFLTSRFKKILQPHLYKDNLIKFTAGDPGSDQFAIIREKVKEEDYQLLLQNSQKMILQFRDLTVEKEIGFLLVIIPYGHQVNDKEWGKGRKLWHFEKGKVYSSRSVDDLVNFTQKEKIKAVNLLPAFQKAKRSFFSPSYYFSYDGHWNSRGHQLAAKELFGFLRESF